MPPCCYTPPTGVAAMPPTKSKSNPKKEGKKNSNPAPKVPPQTASLTPGKRDNKSSQAPEAPKKPRNVGVGSTSYV